MINYIRRKTPDFEGLYICIVRGRRPTYLEEMLLEWNGYKWIFHNTRSVHKLDVVGYIGPFERPKDVWRF